VAPVANTRVSNEFTSKLNPLDQLRNFSTAARLELLLLVTLLIVFVIDSVVLSRRRIERAGSHSLVHAVVIFVILLGVLFGSGGKLI
jgi:hypothetical protein